MATATENVQATEKEQKPKYKFSVDWERGNGEWTTVESERSFDVPDPIASIEVRVIPDTGNVKDEKKVERNFKRRLIRTPKDALDLHQENPYFGMALLNYALDLFYRSAIKGPIAQEVEGPGRTIAKMAEQLVKSRAALGKPISLERALQLAAALQDAE